MLFRFLIISLLKLLSTLGVIFVLYTYLPITQFGRPLLILTWIVIFILAFVFATWALAKKLPVRSDVLTLLTIWLAVTVSGFLIYGIFLSSRGAKVIVALEILTQLSLEVAAIFLAALVIRRRALKTELGE